MPPRISLVHQFEQQQSETWELAFSHDGKQLVSSDGKALYLWQLNKEENWNYERSLPFREATFPRFAPNGQMIAFGGQKEFVKLISIDGQELAAFPSPSHARWAFSFDGRWLVCSDREWRGILLWDLSTYQNYHIPMPFAAFEDEIGFLKESVGRFCFTPDSQRLALGGTDDNGQGCIYICHFDAVNKQLLPQKIFPRGCMDLAISPDGRMLATIDYRPARGPIRQEIYVYDLESFQQLGYFPCKEGDFYCLLAFSPDSRFLASCTDESGSVDLFSLETFEQVASLEAHPGLFTHAGESIGGLDWSKTGFIATGGANVFKNDMEKTDYTIKIWRVEDNRAGAKLPGRFRT